MRKARFALALLSAIIIVAFDVSAQDKPKPDGKAPTTTLKVQVTISEHEGEKKIVNLPYTFFLVAAQELHNSAVTKVRMGSRVPVATGSFQSSGAGTGAVNPLVNTQFQYIDVGTNIDARATTGEDGRFNLTLDLERSWVEGEFLLPGEKQTTASGDANSREFRQPIIRQFRTELSLPIHDGQTIQSTQATDPLSGKILTITVTLNAVK
jgi:hypothetical protein